MSHFASRISRACLTCACLLPLSTPVRSDNAYETFTPSAGKGPVVIVIGGQTGIESRKPFARQLADLGYYVALIDGNDVMNKNRTGGQILRTAIDAALASPHAGSTKVAVVGFSLGGGGVLAYAMGMNDKVDTAVAYYPATFWAKDVDATVGRFKIPLLVLAGVQDNYKDCCLIEKARQIETAAKAQGKVIELVSYDRANHAFDLPGPAYRDDDMRDAWQRTVDWLARLHPPK